jgi:hypothetical protein
MALQPKPVEITYVDPGSYTGRFDPKPLLAVQAAPQAAITPVEIPDVPASFADEDAIKDYLDDLVAALVSQTAVFTPEA